MAWADAGPARPFRFSIDRGGTFTDVYAEVPGPKGFRVLKLLSEDPHNYPDAPREGVRRILEEETGVPHPRDQPLDTSRIDYIRMGTTVATNALLERQGEPCALVITKGFRDLLYIGNQSRPNIFDLEIRRPELLYKAVVEVDERIVLDKNGEGGWEQAGANGDTGASATASSATASAPPPAPVAPAAAAVVQGVTGEGVRVVKEPDLAAVRSSLQAVLDQGITSLAVVFLHSYTFAEHEQRVGRLAEEMGFTHVSLSSEVMSMVKVVPRGFTTAADAYLTPVIARYVKSFRSGFDQNFDDVKTLFMQSDGGLTPVASFRGSRAILSGPAGGVVGYAATSYGNDADADADAGKGGKKEKPAVIGFDMGGTSTDVSRFAGVFEHVFETVTAGVTLQSPQLDINTVAAGGGSRLFFRNGLFAVGPQSAGAHPGPVCYRKSGHLAVTDANVFLGRVIPRYFPKIFGPGEDEALDAEGPRLAFEEMAKQVNDLAAAAAAAQAGAGATPPPVKTADDVAYGFIRVANEAMCRPIRNLTTMKVWEKVRALEASARADLANQGFQAEDVYCQAYLNLRFQGTDTALMTPASGPPHKAPEPGSGGGSGGGGGGGSGGEHGGGDTLQSFFGQYRREFGFVLEGRAVVVDDVRVRAVGRSPPAHRPRVGTAPPGQESSPVPVDRASCYWEGLGRVNTAVHKLAELKAGHRVEGPAILIQDVSTVVVEPGCIATVSPFGDVAIEVGDVAGGGGSGDGSNSGGGRKRVKRGLDPVYLSIFAHRFMGIAEQMGRTLQRTSISVNIKERLDFSCAVFDATGGLVANAPHLPVHLGAMQEAVRYQVRHWGTNLKAGDVLLSNHPQLAGGSHLPDMTVITPVFMEGRGDGAGPSFFVASRGHHADVGGIAPGSMPPLSKILEEEGAAIVAFKLVTIGAFDEKGVSQLLRAPGERGNPACSGTRNLQDNLSDLRAQVAANTRGVALLQGLVSEYGLDVISAYMGHIQDNAEGAVRQMLADFSLQMGLGEVGTVSAEDFMDDGTPIRLAVTVNRTTRSALFDFEGTGAEVFGNLNAPPAVTASAVIYALRCLLPGDAADVPLNQGCLAPVEIRIPEGCLLNPSAAAAVVGGNVLTSQRVTDVILKCFRACAASQGCMNNLTFGDEAMGYYETIAGGAGAGPTWSGCSGVHTHMTNTRITDPEILERRYPVILNSFGLRRGSGGGGARPGGDGVSRSMTFRKPLTVSVLSERRAFRPWGLAGGLPAERGLNFLRFRAGGRTVSLGGKNTVAVDAGDRLTILTPGGGGHGTPRSPLSMDVDTGATGGDLKEEEEEEEDPDRKSRREAEMRLGGGSVAGHRLGQEQA
ncbi:unnamed protein product [Pylaiella littoralis]